MLLPLLALHSKYFSPYSSAFCSISYFFTWRSSSRSDLLPSSTTTHFSPMFCVQRSIHSGRLTKDLSSAILFEWYLWDRKLKKRCMLIWDSWGLGNGNAPDQQYPKIASEGLVLLRLQTSPWNLCQLSPNLRKKCYANAYFELVFNEASQYGGLAGGLLPQEDHLDLIL